jgi:predicted DNA binding protein
MWLAKFKLVHDCIMGTRCKRFGVVVQAYEINEEKRGKEVLTQSLHQIIGEKEAVAAFIKDLKKDKNVKHLEVNKNTVFIIDNKRHKTVSQFSKKLFFVKPVVVDKDGWEHWELAAHEKEDLSRFMERIKPESQEFILQRFGKTPLQDIYFAKVLPMVTDLQKKAFELAVQEGYFATPRKTDLRRLAAMMHLSLSTYQNHLRKAESKILPDILHVLK